MTLYLIKNDNIISNLEIEESGRWVKDHTMVHLNKNDVVRIQCATECSLTESMFVGVLVRPSVFFFMS